MTWSSEARMAIGFARKAGWRGPPAAAAIAEDIR
jgi:hypothetical protein